MTKGVYKPTFVFMVALIIMLTAHAAVSASETEDGSVSYLINSDAPSTTINFEGTVLSDISLIGARRFEVRIDNRISGPEPCKNPIVVEMQVGPYCNGYIDSDIEVGDNVEVYGIYAMTGFGGLGCYVDLCMNGAYIKKILDGCCPCEIITDKETYKPDDPITITVRFCGPSPTDQTVCGYIPSAQSFSFTTIEGCDGFNYAVWWEDTEIYNKVNKYTNKYVRLTGVVLKDPSGTGGRISGFDAIEQIFGCSACGISEYCDPKSFSVLIHSPDKTVTLTKKDSKKVSTGTYMFTGTIGDPGPRTVEVNVEGCPTMEKEFYVTSCCPCQINTRDPTAEIGYLNPANHTDVIVRFASQCSDTICGRVTTCFPWLHIKGCGRHGVNYYVLSDKPDIYNELCGHVLDYVRLTGVVIEGYGILGDPFIGGYDTIEEISSCSECEGVQYCNPSSFIVLLHEQPDSTTDITEDFYRYAKGIYRVTLPTGDVGTKRIEVSAPGCPPIEKELHLIGSTICGQVHWSLEYVSIEACDGLTYPVVTCAYDLHDRLKEYDGKNVRLSSVVMEGYYDASTPCIADCNDILEISNCSECDSDKFIDGCTEISSPGYYKLISNIHNSVAQCCIKITASDVVFDGSGHYIDGLEAQDTCGVCVGSSSTLSNVTVKNVTVRRWGTGILFSGVENGKIENNQARWNKDYGIIIRDSRHNDIRNNIAESNMDGIYLMDSNSNSITDNTASANYGGIGFIRSSSNNVIKNSASGGYLGIDLYQDSNNNNIANNTVEYNLNHGLYIDSSSTGNAVNQNVICSNNRIDGGYYDICNNATNSGEGNTCDTTYNWNDTGTTACTYKCRTYDVSNCMEINAPGYYRLTRDLLNSTAQCCIKITASHVIFDGQNHVIRGVDGLDTCGVCVNSTSMLSDVTIENLTVNDWHYGIYFQNAKNGKIDNNTASHNKVGILLANSSNNYITNNNASHNLLHGIYLGYWHETIYIEREVKWSSNNTVRNNTVSNNDGGIVLRYAKDNTLTNNTAEYNNDGLTMFSGSKHNSITDNIFCFNKLYDLFDEPYYEYVVDKAVMKEKGNSGSNNTCDATYSWNDTSTVGCRYKTCWYKQPRPPVFNSPAVFPFSKIFLGEAPDHLLDKALLSGTVAISITAPDPFGELLSVNLTLYKNEARILTIPLRHTSGTGAWQERWNSTEVADGVYTMEATSTYSTSTGMFRYSASLPVIRDNTPPAITITNPGEGQEIYDYICVISTAQDANGIPGRVNWTLDGKCFANWTAYQLCSLSRPVGPIGVPAELAKGMALLDTSEFENGAYTLKAEATDFVGNRKTSEINVAITTPPISIEEVTIEDPGYYGDYYEKGYFRLYTLGTNIVQIKVKLKNSGDSDGKAVVSLNGLDPFFKCFYVPDRVITVPANKTVIEDWTFNISHYDPLNGWTKLLEPGTYPINVSVNSLSKKKVLDYNDGNILIIKKGAAFKCTVTGIDYEEVDNGKLDVGENFLLKFKIENVGDEDVHDITVYSDRRWDGFIGRHDLWCRKWDRFPNDPGINAGSSWNFWHRHGIISGVVMSNYTKEEVAEVYYWCPSLVGIGRLNFEIEMEYPNSSVNYWTTCLEPVTLQFYEYNKTLESTVKEDKALKVTVLGLGDVDTQAKTRDVKIEIENKQKIYYNYRIDNEPTDVWDKMRTFIVPEGRIETVVAAKEDDIVDDKYQFNVTYKDAWDFNFLNGFFMALSPILPYPLDDFKTVIECTVYAAQDAEDIDITEPHGLADWILQHYDQFGQKFVNAAKDHYGVDIDKEMFGGKLTDLFALYELGMDVVGVLGWSLDWADAPVNGELIVTVLPEGYYVIGEAMPPSHVFTIKTQEVDSPPKSKTSHSQNSTMKMHDTGYKIHDGVNTISGVCESADTKQNISLCIARIRWHQLLE